MYCRNTHKRGLKFRSKGLRKRNLGPLLSNQPCINYKHSFRLVSLHCLRSTLLFYVANIVYSGELINRNIVKLRQSIRRCLIYLTVIGLLRGNILSPKFVTGSNYCILQSLHRINCLLIQHTGPEQTVCLTLTVNRVSLPFFYYY